MIENEFHGKFWTKKRRTWSHHKPKQMPVVIVYWYLTNWGTNLVLRFVWLMFKFLTIRIYRLSYWHLGRFLPLLWSWLIIWDVFEVFIIDRRMNVSLSRSGRPTSWIVNFMFIVRSSILTFYSDVSDGIWPPQFRTFFLSQWCGDDVAQLRGFIYFFSLSALFFSYQFTHHHLLDHESTSSVEFGMSQSSEPRVWRHLFLAWGLQWPLPLVRHLNFYFSILIHSIISP